MGAAPRFEKENTKVGAFRFYIFRGEVPPLLYLIFTKLGAFQIQKSGRESRLISVYALYYREKGFKHRLYRRLLVRDFPVFIGLSTVHFEVLRFFRSLYGRVLEFSEFRVLIWSYNFQIRCVDPGACFTGHLFALNF